MIRAREKGLNFSRCLLRSDKILLQNSAILCNTLQTPLVRITYDSQCCATRRKRTQFVRLELQISCSNQLSYAGAALYESRFSEFVMTAVSRTRERTPTVFIMEHGRDFVLRPQPRWSLHLDPCDTKNGSACNKQVRATQTETFNFPGAMCVPRPLKYTKNGGSIITYRPGQPSINSRLARLW